MILHSVSFLHFVPLHCLAVCSICTAARCSGTFLFLFFWPPCPKYQWGTANGRIYEALFWSTLTTQSALPDLPPESQTPHKDLNMLLCLNKRPLWFFIGFLLVVLGPETQDIFLSFILFRRSRFSQWACSHERGSVCSTWPIAKNGQVHWQRSDTFVN